MSLLKFNAQQLNAFNDMSNNVLRKIRLTHERGWMITNCEHEFGDWSGWPVISMELEVCNIISISITLQVPSTPFSSTETIIILPITIHTWVNRQPSQKNLNGESRVSQVKSACKLCCFIFSTFQMQ